MTQEQDKARLDEIFEQLDMTQKRWVLARLTRRTDAEAAKYIGIWPESVSRWKTKGVPLDEAVNLLLNESARGASMILTDAMQRAAQTMVDALQDRKARPALPAAKEILDRAGMPVVQKQGVDGEIEIHVHYDDAD